MVAQPSVQKNIEASNGRLVKSLLVTDILRSHRGLKPEGIIELNPEGCELANIIAEDVAKTVDEIMESES